MSLKFLLEVDLHRIYFSVDLSVTVFKMPFFLRTRSVHAGFLLKVIYNKTSFFFDCRILRTTCLRSSLFFPNSLLFASDT